jgi:hypothetical protein
LKIGQISQQCAKLGWTKVSDMAIGAATDEWRRVGAGLRSLTEELMEEDGAEKIATRVSPMTLEVLWNNPKFRPQAEALVREYFAKAEAEAAGRLAAAKAMVEAANKTAAA